MINKKRGLALFVLCLGVYSCQNSNEPDDVVDNVDTDLDCVIRADDPDDNDPDIPTVGGECGGQTDADMDCVLADADPDDNDPDVPTVGGECPENSFGAFVVSLIAPTESTDGRTSLLGTIFDGPNPSPTIWEEAATSGDCRLTTPRNPFCQPSCGGAAACVADDSCQAYPGRLTAGTVEVTGLQTTSGDNSFTMNPIADNYQPGLTLAYPPFSEGDNVTLSAEGSASLDSFSVSARGISQLEVLNDSIEFADGQAIQLQWTSPGNPDLAGIFVLIDISHHGGTKGLIECETADDGSLEIAASLIDELKALGISGFPTVDVTRISKGTNASTGVKLVIESKISKSVTIPGLVSCSEDEDCPAGQTCQIDLKCE